VEFYDLPVLIIFTGLLIIFFTVKRLNLCALPTLIAYKSCPVKVPQLVKVKAVAEASAAAVVVEVG
jgi:hypothetical protein